MIKYFILTKRALLLSIVSLIIVVGVITTLTGDAKSAYATTRKLPIYSVETTKKQVALTFDCAWENSDTQQLLDILEHNGVKATFFTTGDFCNRYPDDIKLIASNGHAIQNHSYAHPHVENIERQKLIDDTTKCDEIIQELTNIKPTLYRAPYGEYSDEMLSVFETDLKHKVIQWDSDSRDWQGRTAEQMVATVLNKVSNGGIILFHNDTKNTPEAIQMLIPNLMSKGYEFVLVEDMIYEENYTIDHTGRQQKSTT